WEGYGFSGGPLVQPCLAEMWLYNHTDSKWDQVTQYTARQQVDKWLNYTLTLPSSYVASNGSVDVAITGQRSIQAGPGIPAFSEGELHSDYIGIEVTGEGGIQYPPDLTLLIDGTDLTNISGDLMGTLDVGDAQGFSTILQEVIDGYTVRPENLTLTLGFTVGRPTAGLLFVSNLSIEYEPVVNLAPHYNGPSDVGILEDSGWTVVVDLDEAFEDDHNKGELVYELMEITHPPGSPPPAIFRLGTATNGNATLEVLPDQDFFGPFPVVYEIRAADLFGLATFGYVNITVIQDPDEPRLDEPGTMEAHERTPFSYTMSFTDMDIPDDEFTFSDDSEYFDIDPVTGKISWTPSSDQIGSHSFHVTVTDRFGLTDTVTMTIKVENSNDPPVITSEREMNAVQDEEATYIIEAEDPDVPYGDVLNYLAFADVIEVSVDPVTGRFTFTPINDNVPQFEITIRVQDMQGRSDEIVLKVNVENVNDAPWFQFVDELTYDQNEDVSYQLLVSDPDLGLDLPEPEVLTYSGVGDDVFLPDASGLVSFVPDQSMVGSHAVTYTITDRDGLLNSTTITWVILDVNDGPQITSEFPDEALEDAAFMFTMEAEDLDGDDLTWSDDTEL
ncbi:MAG: hypothetical protein KAQ96_02825, partial [Thermoplasmata archaeon]|nr:hypothetical protein [Thermoplasmata archaeon]